MLPRKGQGNRAIQRLSLAFNNGWRSPTGRTFPSKEAGGLEEKLIRGRALLTRRAGNSGLSWVLATLANKGGLMRDSQRVGWKLSGFILSRMSSIPFMSRSSQRILTPAFTTSQAVSSSLSPISVSVDLKKRVDEQNDEYDESHCYCSTCSAGARQLLNQTEFKDTA